MRPETETVAAAVAAETQADAETDRGPSLFSLAVKKKKKKGLKRHSRTNVAGSDEDQMDTRSTELGEQGATLDWTKQLHDCELSESKCRSTLWRCAEDDRQRLVGCQLSVIFGKRTNEVVLAEREKRSRICSTEESIFFSLCVAERSNYDRTKHRMDAVASLSLGLWKQQLARREHIEKVENSEWVLAIVETFIRSRHRLEQKHGKQKKGAAPLAEDHSLLTLDFSSSLQSSRPRFVASPPAGGAERGAASPRTQLTARGRRERTDRHESSNKKEETVGEVTGEQRRNPALPNFTSTMPIRSKGQPTLPPTASSIPTEISRQVASLMSADWQLSARFVPEKLSLPLMRVPTAPTKSKSDRSQAPSGARLPKSQ